MDTINEFLRGITMEQAVWLIPVIHIVHLLEESPRFVPWARKHMGVPYTKAKFVVENVVLFTFSLVSVALVVLTDSWLGPVLALSGAVGFFLNAFFHAGFTIRTREYSPGTWTSIFLFVPFAFLLFGIAARSSMLDVTTVLLSLLLGVGLLPAVVFAVHELLDGRIFKRLELKTVIIGAIPFVAVPLLGLLVGEELMRKVMLYSAPLFVLPLLLKAVAKAKERRSQ